MDIGIFRSEPNSTKHLHDTIINNDHSDDNDDGVTDDDDDDDDDDVKHDNNGFRKAIFYLSKYSIVTSHQKYG